MGGKESKIENPNANVVNNIEIIDHTSQLDSLWYLLLISTVLCAVNLLLKIYLLHKRSLRKRYVSRANDLEKI